jgi:hypothetical protein
MDCVIDSISEASKVLCRIIMQYILHTSLVLFTRTIFLVDNYRWPDVAYFASSRSWRHNGVGRDKRRSTATLDGCIGTVECAEGAFPSQQLC